MLSIFGLTESCKLSNSVQHRTWGGLSLALGTGNYELFRFSWLIVLLVAMRWTGDQPCLRPESVGTDSSKVCRRRGDLWPSYQDRLVRCVAAGLRSGDVCQYQSSTDLCFYLLSAWLVYKPKAFLSAQATDMFFIPAYFSSLFCCSPFLNCDLWRFSGLRQQRKLVILSPV